ncbi:MAG: pyridoxamine 5-phosphate oxidase-related, FMN-binding [Chitinophagaceae bacterium]|nr:pyridoxamine 5-phosphate oxidase-related, FMN-binding [Chitinophagaceae bacterium]
MFGELNQKETENVLTSQYIGRIGCHAGGFTYIVPISYVYYEEEIYAHAKEGMKVKMMRMNPGVCFQVDKIINMGNWSSVVCQGKYEELKSMEDKKQAMQFLLSRHLPYITSKTVQLSAEWPFYGESDTRVSGVLFKIKILSKSGRYEDTPPQSNYSS